MMKTKVKVTLLVCLTILLHSALLFGQSVSSRDSAVSLRTLFPEAFTNTSEDLDELFAPWKGKVRLGRELELTEGPLSNIIDEIDFGDLTLADVFANRVSTTNNFKFNELEEIAKEFLDTYTMNQEGFDDLPDDVKKNLTADLKLEGIVLPQKKILGSDGQELTTEIKEVSQKPRKILDAQGKDQQSGIIQADAPKIILTDPKVDPALLATADRANHWQVFYRRWQTLDPSIRLSLAKIRFLPSRLRARLYISYYFLFSKIKFRKNNGDSIDNLENLAWTRDGSGVPELKDKLEIPVTDPAEYLKSMIDLARRTGILGGFWNPTSKTAFDWSYHFHLSLPEMDKNQSLEKKIDALNILLLLQSLRLGYHSVIMERSGKNKMYGTFINNFYFKGLLKLIATNRVEIRYHLDDPVSELRFLLYYLNLPDEIALPKISKILGDLATPRIMEELKYYGSTKSVAAKLILIQNENSKLNNEDIAFIIQEGRSTEIEYLMARDPQIFFKYLETSNPNQYRISKYLEVMKTEGKYWSQFSAVAKNFDQYELRNATSAFVNTYRLGTTTSGQVDHLHTPGFLDFVADTSLLHEFMYMLVLKPGSIDYLANHRRVEFIKAFKAFFLKILLDSGRVGDLIDIWQLTFRGIKDQTLKADILAALQDLPLNSRGLALILFDEVTIEKPFTKKRETQIQRIFDGFVQNPSSIDEFLKYFPYQEGQYIYFRLLQELASKRPQWQDWVHFRYIKLFRHDLRTSNIEKGSRLAKIVLAELQQIVSLGKLNSINLYNLRQMLIRNPWISREYKEIYRTAFGRDYSPPKKIPGRITYEEIEEIEKSAKGTTSQIGSDRFEEYINSLKYKFEKQDLSSLLKSDLVNSNFGVNCTNRLDILH